MDTPSRYKKWTTSSLNGRHLHDFGIILPHKCGLELLNEDRFLNINHAALQAQRDNMCEMLNEEQRRILECIWEQILKQLRTTCFS
jgi:hypothetical protein